MRDRIWLVFFSLVILAFFALIFFYYASENFESDGMMGITWNDWYSGSIIIFALVSVVWMLDQIRKMD